MSFGFGNWTERRKGGNRQEAKAIVVIIRICERVGGVYSFIVSQSNDYDLKQLEYSSKGHDYRPNNESEKATGKEVIYLWP